MSSSISTFKGLTNAEVVLSREKYGKNTFEYKKEYRFFHVVKSLVKEPMVLLLLVTSTIYFISGNIDDGIFLAAAILIVSTISLYQDSRSRNALEKLKDFTKPVCKVIRDGLVVEINSADLVIGDSMMVEEGIAIPADGIIVQSNDFSVNESILTGESLAVYKDSSSTDNLIFSGTTVETGLAIATVSAIGNQTKLGKIGKSLESIIEEKTPLELQINNFVKKMVIIGGIVFIIVWAINYFHSYNLLDSLIKALTLAMSILPEEIPVAFTTFMALGAWRLMKLGIVVKQMKTVETLGSATVICTDKTGTITENRMSLAKVFSLASNKITSLDTELNSNERDLIRLAMWASEPIPFDPMEVALHSAYENVFLDDERPQFNLIHEYPLNGRPPMMTHVFENESGIRIIAVKGAPEAIINVTKLMDEEKQTILKVLKELALEGYRLLAVGKADFQGDCFPAQQNDFQFQFMGVVAFYDPPKVNIKKVLQDFYNAGIAVKIITGDNAETTSSIAKQICFMGYDKSITGDELMLLNDLELNRKVKDTNIFTRMFPEAKLKIINALKSNQDIVAMTGDGVNDGPALKAAHIGIAMGKKGTEIAKQAASLILLEDDLSSMVDAVAMGRRIYTNLKKAIRYIISIHIPIILTVFIPLALGWIYPNIFSPIHIIFLELIMGPTCSIIYENEPMEENTMQEKPRPFSLTFFNWKELSISIVQGIAITVGTITTYLYSVSLGYNEGLTRTMIFVVLISSNIFLTLVNRSFYFSVIASMKNKNNLVVIMIGVTIFITAMLLLITPLRKFFEFESLTYLQLLLSIFIGFACVIWFEFVKYLKRKTNAD